MIGWLSPREAPTSTPAASAVTSIPNRLPQGGREPAVQRDQGATASPVKLLIAALGGEGGGVLTNWIVAAAAQAGYPVQSTSIPGVAQRTGATTYYIEILPEHAAGLGSKRPVLALTPGVGDIDVAVTSELLEAGRTVTNGFVTPDRTHVIASLSRFYAMDEKIAMGDGRFDQDRLIKTVQEHARDALLIDMGRLARESGSIISAVMLGAIAGSGRLPLSPEQFEAAIRADGKAVDANLRGFRAGLEAARAKLPPAKAPDAKKAAPATRASLEQAVAWTFPALAQANALEGERRLVAYQGSGYARRYIERLKPIAQADEAAGAKGRLLKEVARHLAVRMSYEDVVRVAQAKIAPERMRRIARDELGVTHEPFTVHDFLKPGIEELTQLLPPLLARPILYVAKRRGWLGHVYFGMEVETTAIGGFLKFLMLAKLRRVRPFGRRFKEEQKAIDAWLAQIAQAAQQSIELALEVTECARLIKGYGDTHARGVANFAAIEQRVIRPALGGHIALAQAIDAVVSARTAALTDPEGESLARCLAEIEGHADLPRAAE
ncbi:MAG: indolepyruvate oxidoreductase subunit beta family protein [Pseudolabrys sp.]